MWCRMPSISSRFVVTKGNSTHWPVGWVLHPLFACRAASSSLIFGASFCCMFLIATSAGSMSATGSRFAGGADIAGLGAGFFRARRGLAPAALALFALYCATTWAGVRSAFLRLAAGGRGGGALIVGNWGMMRCGRKDQGSVLQSLVTDEFVENDEVVLGAGSHGDCRGARKSKL